MRSLILIGALAAATFVSAQCTPNELYADSAFGVWPDTTTNFRDGFLNVFYSDTINVMIPLNAGEIDPDYSFATIDSVRVDGMNGLPPGLSTLCNSQTSSACMYLPTVLGCGLVEGTPTQVGVYDMVLSVTAFAHAPFLGNFAVPYEFTGYRIIISSGTGLADLTPVALAQVRNVPNPFSNRTSIEFSLSRSSFAKIKVFNLVGEELWRETVQGKGGLNRVPFDAARLQTGVYLYKVEAGDRTFTGRMVVSR